MIHKLIVTALKIGVVAFLLFVLLFADGILATSPNFMGSSLREITAALRDTETQSTIFLCLGIYFTAFLFLRSRAENSSMHGRRKLNPNLWLVYMLAVSAVVYPIHYLPSAQALTLLGGAVLGQGVMVWASFEVRSQKSEVGNDFCLLVVSIFVFLLVLASGWNMDSAHFFEYRNNVRWSGPWDNPNVFGLLMGTGVALTLGLASGAWRLTSGKFAVVVLCFVVASLMSRGLLHSYSRGAWLGTVCGLAYLIGKSEIRSRKPVGFSCGLQILWLRKNWLPISIILASTFMLCFWHNRQTNWHPARRALSAVNTVDFSWRNRIAAWEGALQITAEHPWFGAGWNQPEPMYQNYYLPPKVAESAAIQMNDYLMMGTTLGIPALICFGRYLWLSLAKKLEGGKQGAEVRSRNPKLAEAEWLKITCRAGAIVLLVGFWFDGGLFKLATGSTFWILLELGNVQNKPRMDTN